MSVLSLSVDNNANKTAVEYTDTIDMGNMIDFQNLTVNVTVSYYNTSGSISNGNTNVTLWLEVYDGNEWYDLGDFNVDSIGSYSIESDNQIDRDWETFVLPLLIDPDVL